MEPRITHHSQPNFTAREQAWGGTPVHLRERAWTEQAPGEHRASSRRAQRRTEEGKHLLDTQEVPPWHGEAVPMQP
jgi:hypothetical protein